MIRKYLELIYIDHIYSLPAAHSPSAIPMRAYHLKLRLSRKTFFEFGISPDDMRIFLISKPFPAMPITNRATATKDSIGCDIKKRCHIMQFKDSPAFSSLIIGKTFSLNYQTLSQIT